MTMQLEARAKGPGTARSVARGTAARKPRSRIYLGLALGMSVTVYWGFGYTYFRPVLTGAYSQISPALHLHGWSFFLWFLLLPAQALLIGKGRRHTHIVLGGVSIALAVVMVLTGVLVASVRIDQGLSATNPDELTAFWKDFGQLIMFNMLVFVGFYCTAIAKRDRPGVHKRMMVLASAGALPAAIFRVIVGLFGFYWLATPGWVMPAAFYLPAAFIMVGMAHDRLVHGSVHQAYLVGLPVLLAVHGLGLLIVGTSAGEAVSRVMAVPAHLLGAL